jgi:ferredoxin
MVEVRLVVATGAAHHPDGGITMKVWIDTDACVGNGVCEEACPELFHFDGTLAYVKSDGGLLPKGRAGVGDVPDHLIDKVIEAAEECPPGCIYIEV